jgi:hypothetical protein
VHATPLELDEKEDVQPAQPDGVDGEEVTLDDPGRLLAEELAPAEARSARDGLDAVAAQDVPDRARRKRVAEPGGFAVDAVVAPARVLGRERQHELARLRRDRRSARWSPREGPAAADELAMPTQQRRRLEQQRTRTRQRLAERGEHDPVGGPQLRPRHLTAEHLQLVPQQQDLHLLPLLRTSEQEHQLATRTPRAAG